MPENNITKEKFSLQDVSIDVKENYILKISDELLKILLKDRTTNKNIVWATSNYKDHGHGYTQEDQITIKNITGKNGNIIKPRIEKSKATQIARVKNNAEVFTPSWVCNHQNNLIDNAWFGSKDIFNKETNNAWKTIKRPIPFKNNKTWQEYVQQRRMEITCGEAPYLVSRYDTTTGTVIPIQDRIGILDRKLRVICENINSEQEWIKWTKIAYQNTYGYEYQGDNLLLARENLLLTFADYYYYKFAVAPIVEYLLDIAEIISWNIWQMDGLNGNVPYAFIEQFDSQQDLFQEIKTEVPIQSKIMDWNKNRINKYQDVKGDEGMKFDVVIGNPPYQLTGGAGGNNDSPLYQFFVEAVLKLKPRYSSLIIPARWFSAGREHLLKNFRINMLNNKSIKSLSVFPNSRDIFPNVEIKGGVCYFLIDNKYIGKCCYSLIKDNKVETFKRDLSDFEVLIRDPYISNLVKKIVGDLTDKDSVYSMISNDTPFGISSNVKHSKKKFTQVYETKTEGHNILLYHIENQKRKIEYININSIKKNEQDIDKFKVFIPESGGSGNDMTILGKPEFAPRNSVCSQSYLYSAFNTELESLNFLKYLKTKFLRILVSSIKISQSAPNRVYRFVPLQNFTNKSDIDWSKSISEIDKQLYKKYNLNEEEISFIETHVKEME